MTGINDRLKLIRNSLSITQREFAGKLSVSQSMYADWETGNLLPKERYLKLISLEFNINLDWLRDGTGEMSATYQADMKFEHLKDIFVQLSPELQDVVLENLRGLLKVQKEKKI